MRTLKLSVAYDGTRYAGWQRQDHVKLKRPPTIQAALEQVFAQILQEPVTVIGSGRTDAGAHAQAQAAHLKTRSAMPCKQLCRAVNHLLPGDIAVTRIEEAPSGFHAQYDAAGKHYRYRIFTGAVVPPFIRPYVHHVYSPLNVARMRREAAALKGRHDFAAFARLGSRNRRAGARSGHGRKDTVRRLSAVSLRRRGSELVFDVEGTGFLYTMVRSMIGTLLDVGRGRLPSGHIRRLLQSRNRNLAGTTAPAKGLTLVSVAYGGRNGPTT